MNPRLVLAAALLLSATSALAGNWVEMSVRSRDSGQILETHRHQGKTYVAGQPGDHYAIRLTNQSSRRLLVVLSVDGVNAISGQTAAPEQSGYVLEPGDSTEVTGWRKSADEVAGFYFTRLPDSYAARTDRPANVGVIGAALFREATPPRPPVARPLPYSQERAESGAPAGDGSAAAAAPRSSLPRPDVEAGSQIGTGHGAREAAPVTFTHFRRASSRPDEVISIYYDSRDNLVRRGVIRSYPDYPVRPEPRPFPGGFAPDPWR